MRLIQWGDSKVIEFTTDFSLVQEAQDSQTTYQTLALGNGVKDST